MGLGAFFYEWSDPTNITQSLSQDQLTIYENRGSWYMINYGIAVISGTLACVLLFFKSKWAIRLAIASFITITISTLYNALLSGLWPLLTLNERGFSFAILFMSILLMAFARTSAERGWLK